MSEKNLLIAAAAVAGGVILLTIIKPGNGSLASRRVGLPPVNSGYPGTRNLNGFGYTLGSPRGVSSAPPSSSDRIAYGALGGLLSGVAKIFNPAAPTSAPGRPVYNPDPAPTIQRSQPEVYGADLPPGVVWNDEAEVYQSPSVDQEVTQFDYDQYL